MFITDGTIEGTREFPSDPLVERRIFAAMAMQGMNSNSGLSKLDAQTIARWAVEQADALINEINNWNSDGQ